MSWYGLVSEDGKDVSIGRCSFWIVLGLMIWFWLFSVSAIPPTLITAFEWVMSYNFGKKVLSTASTVVTAIKG
jgi:hypothetical protein